MKTYLVTGGAGFIGSHIVTALVEQGHQVRVLDDLSGGFKKNLAHLSGSDSPGNVELIEACATCPQAMAKAAEGVDTIFHKASIASVPASLRDPLKSHAACLTSTVNVLTEAQRAGVRRVVLAASSAAYGDQPYVSKRETDTLDPLSPYAAAKIASEYYLKAFTNSFGLETVSLRYFNVYGPRQDPASEYSAVIPIFVSRMLAGKRPTVYGDGMQSRDFVFVKDVVRANLLASESTDAVGESINIACGRQSSLLDLIDAVNSAIGKDLKPIFDPPRAGDVLESMADITQARKLLGYEPSVSLEEGLHQSIDYYRSITS